MAKADRGAEIKLEPNHEIRRNPDGSLDEVVACCPNFFHLEQMSDSSWWIGLETQDGRLLHFSIRAAKPPSNKKRGFKKPAPPAYKVYAETEEVGKVEAHHCVLCKKKTITEK